MYNLDINFLSDRAPIKNSGGKKAKAPVSPGDLTPIYIGVAVALFFPALAGTTWWILQQQNAELTVAIVTLEQENQRLEAEIGSINKIKEETNRIKSETQALVTVFDQIRPWSAMLEDLRDRIPQSVQIENVKQTPPIPAAEGQPAPNPAGGIQISGLARTFNDVNDFMLSLQQSKFLKGSDTKITTAELIDAPLPPSPAIAAGGVPIKPPQIVKYTIQSSMSDVPASELMRELEQKGTVGLVARIRAMQQKGVIER